MKIRARFESGEIRDFEATNYKLDDEILIIDGNSYDGVVEAFEIIEAVDVFDLVDEIFKIKDEAIQKGGYTREMFDREEELLMKYYNIRGIS